MDVTPLIEGFFNSVKSLLTGPKELENSLALKKAEYKVRAAIQQKNTIELQDPTGTIIVKFGKGEPRYRFKINLNSKDGYEGY